MQNKFLWFICMLVMSLNYSYAQTRIPTNYTSGSLSSGSSTANMAITFGIENTNPIDIILTDIDYYVTANSTRDWSLWYIATPLTGPPNAISVANGWTEIAIPSTVPGPAVAGVIPVLTNINFTIPANTIYRFALVNNTGSVNYYAATSAPNFFMDGGVRLLTGDNNAGTTGYIGYVGTHTNANSFHPRFFHGAITFVPGGPGEAPNDAGVSEVMSPFNFCAGTQDVRVLINNYGANRIDSVKVGWEIDGVLQSLVSVNTALDTIGGIGVSELEVSLGSYNFTNAAVDFKAWTFSPNGVVDTVYANDTIEYVFKSSLSGQYTVNAGLPTGGSNYESFADLISDLEEFGICGPVIVDVVPNSGPYNELIAFKNIEGTNAANYIRINGNGNTVEYANTTTAGQRHLLLLEGAKHIRIDNLVFKALSAATSWGALITGGSEFDSLTNCVFDLGVVTATASASNSGILFSGSNSSATTTGINGSNCYIAGNHILGSNNSGAPYYGIVVAGSGNNDNIIENNIIENYYFYGIYINAAERNIIRNNELHNTNRSGGFTTNYGIYSTGSTPGMKIIGNRIHHPSGTGSSTSDFYGIRVNTSPSADPMLIANNLISQVNQGGYVYGIYLSGATAAKVFHNTVDFSEPLNSASPNYGIYSTGTAIELEVKNNSVSITGGGTGDKYGFYYNTGVSLGTAQKNNFYVNSSQGGTSNYGYYDGTAYPNQATFQGANIFLEVGSPNVNPMYENPTLGNFRPGAGALVGTGENVLSIVSTDILGGTRTTAPTIGAFEVSPDDVGVSYIYLPSDSLHCSGKNDVFARVRNYGSNPVDSFEVNWTIDGILQQPLHYDFAQLYVGDSVDIYLGIAKLFQNSNVEIKAWTSNPNGVFDIQQYNDSFTTSYKATLSGFDMDISPGDTMICRGRSVTLNAGVYNNNPLYVWSTGDTIDHITVQKSGIYSVSIWSEDGCFASDTVDIVIASYPQGEDIGVVEDGAALVFTVLKDKYVDEYIWNFGDGKASRNGGVTEANYYEENGLYTVSATLRNDCGDTVLRRQVFVENAVGISGTNNIQKDIIVYPNPARDEFTIKSKGQEMTIESYEIYNILGQKVTQQKGNKITSEIIVNTSTFASGIYHIKLQTDRGRVVKKVEVLR